MKDLTLAFTIIIKGCIANKMTPEQMASQLNEHVQHEVKNLNIPAVVGRSEQLPCSHCDQLEPCAGNSPETCYHPKVC